MKIAIIIPGELPVPPVKGGAIENLVYTLIKENEVSEKPINIDLYGINADFNDTYNTNQKYTRYNMANGTPKIFENKVIASICYRINYSYFLEKTINNIREKEYDYIIIQNRPNYIKKISSNNNSKIILHMHNEHLTKNIDYQSELELCHMIFVVSEYIKNTIVQRYEIDPDKIKVIHNGIDNSKFCVVSKEQKNKLRKRFNLRKEDFVILFTGRMIKEKGILQLINSVLNIKEDIKLLVVGAKNFANSDNDDFTSLLHEKCRNMEDKIIFTGYIDYEEVPNVYSIADIAVLPSIFNDPFPLAVLECMSVGLPIISTVSGGIPEMVNSKCGTLILRDENLEDNLKNTIINYYENRESLDVISKECEKRVKNFFTNEKFYKRFIKYLK